MPEPQKVSDLIERICRDLEVDPQLDALQAKKSYAIVVGDLINKLTIKINYSKGTLYLQYSSAALANEIFMRRHSLVEKINQNAGRPVVREIRLVT